MMKKILYFCLLIGTLSFGGEINRIDVSRKNNLIYQKGSSKPFTGIVSDQYPNGTIRLRYQYTNGIPNGLSRSYNENGKLQSEIHFRNGVQEGITKIYHKNGKKEGVMKVYDDTGEIFSQTSYQAGQVVK
jgi:antitoxin component YwqK of YwqJK toxin-antitoxin module